LRVDRALRAVLMGTLRDADDRRKEAAEPTGHSSSER
jgi:hypothetical protein